MTTIPTIAYAGMSHLGICSLTAAASKGFSSHGFDFDQALVERLRTGALPVVEPGLDAMLAANRERIDFSFDPENLRSCDLIYVAVDVATDDAGRSDLSKINKLLGVVIAYARPDAVVIVLSQVPPGFTRSQQRPGRVVYYQVETLVFGRAVERATRPERFILGCPDPAAPLPTALRIFLESFECPILPMRLESAELTKIAINCCLAASISVANTLAELCEGIGADWSEIVPALKLDRRIGQAAYLAPGLGISGGNLERDLVTIIELARVEKTDAGVVAAWLANSHHRRQWCWEILKERVLAGNPSARIAVLGLAYKENTHSTKNSPALALVSRLNGLDVRVHDPVVPAAVVPFAKGQASPMLCAEGADAVVIGTPWPQYRELAVDELARVMRGRVIVDPYRMLDTRQVAASGIEYHALGMPPLGLD